MAAAGMGGGTGGTSMMGAAGAPATPSVSCTITPTLTMSTAISTVGIVTFTTDMTSIDSAHIDFGLDTTYGMMAPVDLTEPGYRTLLLGMKPSKDYHYRVVVSAGGKDCTGADNMLHTGDLPNGTHLTRIQVDTPQPDKVSKGYIVTGFFTAPGSGGIGGFPGAGGGSAGPAFIVDADGDYVWWFDIGSDVSSSRMTEDGKYMWIRNVNVQGGNPMVVRVSMDGMDVQRFDINSEFGDGHHDLTVLPDGTVGFIQFDKNRGCDAIVERAPDGTTHQVINAQDAHGSTMCHVNAIHYFAGDDTYTFGDLDQNCYMRVTRQGKVLWVLGGAKNSFTGDGATWSRQHGFHEISPDRMLMFNNGDVGQNSIAYELQLDLTAHTATRVWHYDGGSTSFVLGDVQRLPNGNTLVTYTTSGLMHEVDPDGKLVRSLAWDIGGATSYTQYRDSLYGPPPRY